MNVKITLGNPAMNTIWALSFWLLACRYIEAPWTLTLTPVWVGVGWLIADTVSNWHFWGNK